MKAYKVVSPTVFLGRFVSAFTENKFSVYYEINKKCVPEMGKIFVFKKLEYAKKFVLKINWKKLIIVEGEAENCKKVLRVACFYWDIPTFWALKKTRESTREIGSLAPPGSYVCDSFIPEKIVYEENL